jgi:Ni,Fe-hydrogenase III large subunit
VGFTFAQVQCSRLRELWQRQNRAVFGHRLLMDTLLPGGVAKDLDSRQVELLSIAVDHLRDELREFLPLLYEYPSLQDRLRTTGVLSLNEARSLGVLGYIAKASGECRDLRRDAPDAPYDDMVITVPRSSEGDASARLQIRGDEILVSLDLLEEILKKLPAGGISVPFPAISKECSGVGFVEGWRGEILAYVHFDAAGTVARYFPRDPSWLNWPALEAMMKGVIVPDFPLCNKSVNGSYSGHDL